jgi:hypothetical protein
MKFSLLALSFFVAGAQAAKGKKSSSRGSSDDNHAVVQLGPRPYYLVDTMKPSFLKDQLRKLLRPPVVLVIMWQSHNGLIHLSLS